MARITVAFMLGALLAMAGCSAEAQSSESMELGTEDADSSRPEATTPPAEEGMLRILDRIDVNGFATGALQVFLDGAWGAVCDSGFDRMEADVACRQLGFSGGVSVTPLLPNRMFARLTLQDRAEAQAVLAPMVLENLNCTGGEERLVDCPRGSSSRGSRDFELAICDPLQGTYAFVACGTASGPEVGEVRLAGGAESAETGAQYGRVEIFSDGGWGRLCNGCPDDRPFRDSCPPEIRSAPDTHAQVICRQLGFSRGISSVAPMETPPSREERRIPILLVDPGCAGDEAGLAECMNGDARSRATPSRRCSTITTASVQCFNGPDSEMDGQIRLADGGSGSGYQYGRLEVFLRGFWSAVCNGEDENFTPDSAQVACKLLGFEGGASLVFRQPYVETRNGVLATNIPVGLKAVDCDGNETALTDCQSSRQNLLDCALENATDTTVLACANSQPECNQMPLPEEGSVRLRGGFGTPCDPIHSGFVEVFHRSEWGAICSPIAMENVDRLVADVVCRQLGFPHGTIVPALSNLPDSVERYSDGYSGPTEESEEPQGRFWLSRVACRGPEETLLDCDLGPGLRDANRGCEGQRERLTVACRSFPVPEALEALVSPGAEEGDVRLVEPSSVANWQIGRLEVFFEGSWSQVCGFAFAGADADVACRQLGLGAGTVFLEVPVRPRDTSFGNTVSTSAVVPDAALTSVGCSGSESRLVDCPLEKKTTDLFDSQTCFSADSQGVTIGCVSRPVEGEEGALRLTDVGGLDGSNPQRGVVEIFHAGSWGTVCRLDDRRVQRGGFLSIDDDPPLPEVTATVACRELGFDRGFFQDVESVPADVNLPPPWLARIPCRRLEDSLLDCGPLNFGSARECGLPQRLECTNGTAEARGTARLVGGQSASDGSWAYGTLQVSDGSVFSAIADTVNVRLFGRSAAAVACRSLGFTTGAQLVSGIFSAIPFDGGPVDTMDEITCQGDELTLADCDTEATRAINYYSSNEDLAVALICSTIAGCTENASDPVQGDVRLVPLSGVPATTACDDVHFGAVEFFNAGRWGSICAPNSDVATFAIDAAVVCRQLGFPFGSLIDPAETFYEEPGEMEGIAWASDVLCTGLEDRLDECFFPENFGDDQYSDMYDYGFSTPELPRPDVPQGPPDSQRSPGLQGFSGSCSGNDGLALSVVCRRFEIEESDVIRRL